MTARHEQILDAARDLIVRDGYAGASMHAIARAAGITRPALYAEFGDRDELLTALLDREEKLVLELAQAAMPELPPGTDPAEFGVQLVDVFLDLVLSAPRSWQFVLMPAEGAPPGAYERVERGKAELRERARLLITVAAAAQGREVDAEVLSHGALAVCETAARLVLAGDRALPREEVAKTLRWLSRRLTGSAAGRPLAVETRG